MNKMLTINKENVPKFLKKSMLYKQLKEMNEDTITVPKIFYPDDFIIACIENKFGKLDENEIFNVFEIFRYWMIDELPDQVYDCMVGNIFIDFKDRFHDFSLMKEVEILQNHNAANEPVSLNDTLEKVIMTKSLNLLRFWVEYHKKIVEFNTYHCQAALKCVLANGTVDQFKFLSNMFSVITECMKNGAVVHKYISVILNGNIEVLKYLYSTPEHKCINIELPLQPYPEYYSKKLHVLECIQFVITNKIKINRYILCELASCGDFESIKYLYENYKINTIRCSIAFCNGIKYGNLGIEFAKYMVSMGENIDPNMIDASVSNDDVECFEYLFDKYRDNDKRHTDYFELALEHNSINCIKYIYNIYNEWFPDDISKLHSFDPPSNILNKIAKYGNYKCFKFLIDIGYKYNAYTYICIIKGSSKRPSKAKDEANHLKCLEYLFKLDSKKPNFKKLYNCSYVKQGYYVGFKTRRIGSYNEKNWIKMIFNIAKVHSKYILGGHIGQYL